MNTTITVNDHELKILQAALAFWRFYQWDARGESIDAIHTVALDIAKGHPHNGRQLTMPALDMDDLYRKIAPQEATDEPVYVVAEAATDKHAGYFIAEGDET